MCYYQRMGKPEQSAKPEEGAKIVDFSLIANRKRIRESGDKINEVLENNRKAIERLFSTRMIFEEKGAAAGRDLLLAHQYLLRITKLLRVLDKMEGKIDYDAPEIQIIFSELDDLLNKTNTLTSRTGDQINLGQKG